MEALASAFGIKSKPPSAKSHRGRINRGTTSIFCPKTASATNIAFPYNGGVRHSLLVFSLRLSGGTHLPCALLPFQLLEALLKGSGAGYDVPGHRHCRHNNTGQLSHQCIFWSRFVGLRNKTS